MKKVFLGSAALVAVGFVILVIGPSLVDWTGYRRQIAAEIEQTIGRKVTIDGAIEAGFLPVPRLSLNGVRLGNLSGASSPWMGQAEKLEVHLAFWPLLWGKIVVTSTVLRKPVIVLERLADGRGNWQFTGPEVGNDPIRPPLRFADGVPFNSAVIDEGTFIYRDERSGTIEQVSGVNARFTADGPYGPLRLAGVLRYGAIPLRYNITTGRMDAAGQAATPINVTAEVENRTPVARGGPAARGTGVLNGTFRYGESGLQFGGKLRLSGDDLADFVSSLVASDPLLGFLGQRFTMDGEIELKDKTLTANSMSLQLGETRAEGAISAVLGDDVPRVDIALAIGRINLESWRAAGAKKAAALKLAANSREESEPSDFALPANILMTMDVSIDALTYRGTAARQAHLVAEMSDGMLEFHQLTVQLPGATDAIATGKLQAVAGRAQFDGNAELSSDDFRTLLGWFDMDISKLPAGRLNNVAVLSRVKLTREFLTLDELDLRFDNSRLSGAVVTALHERPAIGANLLIDRIALDAYLPSEFAPAPAAVDPVAPSPIPLAFLTQFDVNLRLSLGQFDKSGTVARNVRLEGNLLDGVFTIDGLTIADLAGGDLSLRGQLDGFAARVRLNLEFDVNAQEPGELLRLAGVVLPLPESAIKPFSGYGRISGDDTAYRIDGTFEAALLSFSIDGAVSLPPNSPPRFAFDVDLQHPDYIDLLRLFDAGFAPEQAAPVRAVNLSGHVASEGRGDYALSAISGSLGPLALDGDVSVAFDGARPRIDAQLLAGDLDSRHFLSAPPLPSSPAKSAGNGERWSRLPLAFDGLRLFDGSVTVSGKSLRHGHWLIDEPSIELTVANGGVDLQRLEGAMMRGEFALKGRLAPHGEDNPVWDLDYNLTISGAELGQALFDGRNIDLSGGRLDLTLEGRASGASEAAMIAALNGKGTLLVENTQLKGFDLARLNARFALTESPGELVRLIQSTLSAGVTRVAKLDGDFTVTDGVVAFDDLRLKTAGGDVRVLFAADLAQWRLDATAEIRLSAQPRAPRIDMQMDGALDAPKREFDSYALQVYLLDEKARQTPLRAAPPAGQPPQTAPRQP